MDFNLRDGLQALHRSPDVPSSPIALDQVRRRVRRGRAVRTGAVALVSATVVAGAATIALAGPWRAEPVPPATSTPEPTPPPTPPAPAEPDLVGVTVEGDLVVIDPENGAIVRTVYRGLTIPRADHTTIGLTVTRDHTVAYVAHVPGFPPDQPLVRESDTTEILRISLADGTATRVADGVQPTVSPDGQTLAYGSLPYSYGPGHGLDLMDLSTGTVRHIDDPADGFGPPFKPIWSPDGSRLYLVKAAAETSPLFLLEAAAAGLDEAVQVGECRDAGSPVFLSDGTLLASCVDHEVHDCIHCGPEAIERFRIDPDTGEVLGRLDELSGAWLANPQGGPAGQVAFLTEPQGGWGDPDPISYDLYIWDGSGETRHVATGLVAIAW